ncbi:hypothetical protein NFI96_006835 [Prochilodus magdalenae]|nr:hypothetical protein NFI96_006835 [Prochilodus magdalenae]
MATETTSSEEEQEFPVSSTFGAQRLSAESPMDGRAMRRSSRGSFTRASLEDLLSIDPEVYQSSVWLGTEDGWWVTIFRYPSLEHPHTVPADGAVEVEVEGHQVFWTCDDRPSILVLTTVPPHTGSLGVSTKTKAGLVTEDDPLPF